MGTVVVQKFTVEHYAGRRGYEEAFLGEKFAVPLPKLLKAAQGNVADVTNARRPGVLDYTHFSVVINKARRMCFYGVVNIDGNSLARLKRPNNWLVDPRLADEFQTLDDVYKNNDLDRGHIVRRLDPAWSTELAKIADGDTFHFTNACPQVHKFNDGIWGQLEDYLLKNADTRDLKLTVFTGPILKKTDKKFKGVQLPSEFWKVAVMVSGNGSKARLITAGFMLSQEDLLAPFEAFPLGPIPTKVKQVAIKDLEKLTGLRFGAVTKADCLTAKTPAPKARVIKALDQVVIKRRKPELVRG